MSDSLTRYLLASAQTGTALRILPGYLSLWAPAATPPADRNVVTFSGTQTFRNLAYIGPSASIVVGRVLLLIGDGAPIILGNLTKP